MNANMKRTNDLSAEEDLVRRYFHEVLDQGKVQLIEDLFHPQCVMHRPGEPSSESTAFAASRSEPRKPLRDLKHKYMTSLDPATGWWYGFLITD